MKRILGCQIRLICRPSAVGRMGTDKMSYEYIAALPNGFSPNLIELLENLQSRLPVVAVSTSVDRVLLRWADSVVRAHWPEDMEIKISSAEMLVLFHVGTAEQRHMLIAAMEELVSTSCDGQVVFVEQ